jgi:uncharacterized Zn finger protein (UPF0148 family)
MGNKPNDTASKDVYSQYVHHSINNIKESINVMKKINEELNKPLSASVLDLMNCFICLCPAIDPVSCPRCNNFACHDCFERYFGNKTKIACPFCKQEIEYYELERKTIIEEIESILNQYPNNQEKIYHLNQLAEQKKNFWNEQTSSINKYMKRINEYKNIFEGYINEEETFFKNCLEILSNILKNFNENLNELMDSLSSFNQKNGESNYKEFNSKNNNYDNEIKEKIKEILSLERKHFNEKNKGDIENFLRNPKFCVPCLTSVKLPSVQLDKYDSDYIDNKTVNSKNKFLGNYEIKFMQIPKTKNVGCSFNFTLEEDYDMSAFIQLKKEEKDGYNKSFPMKFVEKQGLTYFYQYTIPFEEFKEGVNRSFILIPEVKLFSL